MTAEELYQAIGETEPVYLGESEYEVRRPAGRVALRGLLIAAIIAAVSCMTVFAITFSLREAARADMGISEEAPIPEWTEYEGVPKAGEGAEDEEVQVALAATMCSGRMLYVYLEVSPVDAEIAAALADNTSSQYEWNLGGLRPQGGWAANVEQIDYDVETQTALVKVALIGDALEQTEQVELTLYLHHELKPEASYGSVVIPITQAEMISCLADVTVRNVKAHLQLEAGGLDPTDFPDYTAEGRITRLTICAGYLEVELETPGLDQWLPLTGLEQVEIGESDFPDQIDLKKMFLQDCFTRSWYMSVNEALAGATLNYTDGTSQVIDEIPSIYASIWTMGGGKVEDSVYEGKAAYRFTPQKAFDLSAVRSITIGDTEYFFPTGN